DQRSDDRTELQRLVLREVAVLDRLHVAFRVLLDEEQVDESDDIGVLQPLELRQDLARELRVLETNDEDLHGADWDCRLRAHAVPRSLRFSASNSSGVRPPSSFSCESSRSCWLLASDIAPADRAAACTGWAG